MFFFLLYISGCVLRLRPAAECVLVSTLLRNYLRILKTIKVRSTQNVSELSLQLFMEILFLSDEWTTASVI